MAALTSIFYLNLKPVDSVMKLSCKMADHTSKQMFSSISTSLFLLLFLKNFFG